MLSRYFGGKELNYTLNASKAVAYGASLYAAAAVSDVISTRTRIHDFSQYSYKLNVKCSEQPPDAFNEQVDFLTEFVPCSVFRTTCSYFSRPLKLDVMCRLTKMILLHTKTTLTK